MKRPCPTHHSSLDELKAYSEALSELYAELPEITITGCQRDIDLRVREAQAALDRARGSAIVAEFLAQLLLTAIEFKEFKEQGLTAEEHRGAIEAQKLTENITIEVDCQSALSCLMQDMYLVSRERGGAIEKNQINPYPIYIAWQRYLNLTHQRGPRADIEIEKALRAYISMRRGGRPLGTTEWDSNKFEKDLQEALGILASKKPVAPLRRPTLAQTIGIDPKTLDHYLARSGKSFRAIAKAFDDENLSFTI